MRSSLMIGLSLRLAKSSAEGGAPSFFADRTGDTICDDGLFPRIIVISVLISSTKLLFVRRKKVRKKNFVFAPSKNKIILGFLKKRTKTLSVALKKSGTTTERERDDEQNEHVETVVKTERR